MADLTKSSFLAKVFTVCFSFRQTSFQSTLPRLLFPESRKTDKVVSVSHSSSQTFQCVYTKHTNAPQEPGPWGCPPSAPSLTAPHAHGAKRRPGSPQKSHTENLVQTQSSRSCAKACHNSKVGLCTFQELNASLLPTWQLLADSSVSEGQALAISNVIKINTRLRHDLGTPLHGVTALTALATRRFLSFEQRLRGGLRRPPNHAAIWSF